MTNTTIPSSGAAVASNAGRRQLPGPAGSWLLGSLAELRAGMLPFYERCRREYGPVCTFRLGPQRLIFVNEPALIEEVLVTHNKCFQKHYATRLLRPVLGNGLLLSEGRLWLEQRRLIQPAFSRRFTEAFCAIVAEHASRLSCQWSASPQRDLYHDMTRLTVQIAAHAFLGVREAADVEEIGRCLEAIHADFEHRYQRFWNAPLWIPTRRNRRLQGAVRSLTAIIDRMIELRRRDKQPGGDALSLLLAAQDDAGRRMPLQLLRDEVMTLLLAGHDTTANNLTWTWSLLAQHPEVMRRVREEAAEAFLPDCRQAFDRDRLGYVQKVIKESMRLYPPVYLFGREAVCDVSIGGHLVRRGESVVMSQWLVHRDERFFERPEVFDPDRWSEQFEHCLPRYAYFPFGGGPRVCLGKDMAMLEAGVVLATLARQFEVTLEDPEEVEPWPTVTLRPRGAIRAVVSCRPLRTQRVGSVGPERPESRAI